MKKFAVATFAFLIACAGLADVIRVNKQDTKFSLEMTGLTASADPAATAFRRTLEADLYKCGYFSRAGAGQGQIVLSGSAAGSVTAKCYVQGRADQRLYLSKGYSADGNTAVRLAHRVADEIIKAVTGLDGFCSGQVVMVGNASGHKELYLADWDGGGLRQLTRDSSINRDPKWAPGGRKLIYTSYLKGAASLITLDLASGERRQLLRAGGLITGGSYSPDGSKIALIMSKDGNPELYVVGAGGGGLMRLTRTTGADEASPTWSPDGSRICYVSGPPGVPQLYVIGASGGEPQRLSVGGRMNECPDWGRNGLIAYQSNFGGRYQIFVVDPATRSASQVSRDGAAYEDPSWAPDGRHIVATRVTGYQKGVCILDTQSSELISLTNQRGDWSEPAFTPRE